MRDEDVTLMRERLESVGFIAAPKELVRDACIVVAARNVFDSAQMWLEGLRWDGVPRVETFMSVYLGCEDTGYSRAVGRYLWSALAGRVLVPGVKADMVPVLCGGQGKVKSSAIEAMVPSDDFYVEIDLKEAEDKTARKMRGALVGEVAELSGLHTRDREEIKKFVTRKVEKWVPKYREFATSFRRRLVFVGTSNRMDILDDDTGNRRWLPIEVLRAAWLAGIVRDRDQLWAEATVLFRARGVCWQEAEALAPVEHEKFNMVSEDLWLPRIESWLFDVGDLDSGSVGRGDLPFSSTDVAVGALGLSVDKLTRMVSTRICAILRLLGFSMHVVKIDGRSAKRWRRTPI
jgi:predicted P-loop ATPase